MERLTIKDAKASNDSLSGVSSESLSSDSLAFAISGASLAYRIAADIVLMSSTSLCASVLETVFISMAFISRVRDFCVIRASTSMTHSRPRQYPPT